MQGKPSLIGSEGRAIRHYFTLKSEKRFQTIYYKEQVIVPLLVRLPYINKIHIFLGTRIKPLIYFMYVGTSIRLKHNTCGIVCKSFGRVQKLTVVIFLKKKTIQKIQYNYKKSFNRFAMSNTSKYLLAFSKRKTKCPLTNTMLRIIIGMRFHKKNNDRVFLFVYMVFVKSLCCFGKHPLFWKIPRQMHWELRQKMFGILFSQLLQKLFQEFFC